MPNLKKNVLPKYTQINGRAVVYGKNGKPVYLGGAFGSEESKIAYARCVAEMQTNQGAFPQKEDTRTPTV